MDVSVQDVVRTFGATPALHGVSLDIAAGELIALLGPSGSGKTTLIRILAGLDIPTSGRVLFNREDALKLTVQERNVGLVFQNYALFRHMTVAQNIGFGLRVRPRSRRPRRKEIRRRTLELLDFVQLSGLEKRYPSQLSGGQRQRVAFARALAIEPRLELADRVVVMREGKIEQIGTPDEIYGMPSSPFVFSFIGEANRLSVNIISGQVWLDDHFLDLAVSDMPSGPAQLFFRPHDVGVKKHLAGAIPAKVQGMRRHGGVRRLDLEVVGRSDRIEIDLPADFGIDLSEPIGVRPRRYRLYRLSAEAAFSS